jgi:NADH-quinone oxidoreductase subunit M
VRWIALVGAVVSLLVTLPLYAGFKLGTSAMQFVEKAPWIERFNVNYHLGVDGISLWFVLLTAFITWWWSSPAGRSITERVNQYMGAFLILSGLMIGVFCALDGMLFYVFFEATLIPMYLIIGIWGGPNKIYAAFKFFLYTLLGSLLMLVALIYLYTKSGGSFDILTWHKLPLGMARRRCCSSRSSRPLPSRCRCGRSTPGCPTCTWRRPPAAPPCWPPSC